MERRNEVMDYAPVYVTILLLILIGREIVADANDGVWDLFEIGVVICVLIFLAWWVVKTT